MFKKLLLTSLFLNSLLSFSQDIVSSTPVELKKNRDIFQVVNTEKKDVTLFVSDKIKVKAIHLNENMQIVDSISTERPGTKTYDNMIGYNISNNNTRLFWSSDNYQDIYTQLFDFNTRKVETKQYSLVLKEEKILQKFSENENFYILTFIKKSSNLKLHIFDKDGNYNAKTISLEGFHFLKRTYAKTDLDGALSENLLPFELPYTLKYITPENPTSLTDGAKKRKCYFNKNQIIITLDTNVDFTQVFTIDLNTFTAKERMIKQRFIPGDRTSLNSNSFYFENKLYQVKTSSDLLYFTIKDLDDNILKEHFANVTKPIEFKNSEIYQEGGDFFGGKRTLETSAQFIRKVNNLNAGLSCYHIGENTLITFGGVSSTQQSGGQAALGQFGLIGALISVAVYNPTMENFNSYTNRKVVKIEGLFDKEGNNIKGKLQPLAFDKIRTFFDKNTDVSSQTLFKISDFYYLGYYDNKTKEYIIRKFAD
ncbi:hypothetical protein [Flavobacterium sp. KBS0721]|uniref:hypothetical protein n=1 Tax=Flavobacterium sp. KBS0721 TaxID=1179672 RepID=UPI00098F3777|nr:hypothetical protein [Flavobacterium sp. KBS0721]QDW19373.1 hypothetical protein B0M43_0004375 [Flavobacterium sp. KBS0721]